jgi:cytochrome c oxidase subunit 2
MVAGGWCRGVVAPIAGGWGLAGCAGVQSALDPAGTEAERVGLLFAAMLAAALLVWLAVIGAFALAYRPRARPWSVEKGHRLIIWAGAVVPTLLLGVLLYFGLRLMPELRAPGAPGLVIEAQAEQFWWRLRYQRDGAAPVESANELRLPAGQRTELRLSTSDVIHAFWVPALGGKVDMIPGRTNRLVLEPTRTGRFRGVCAEFCGPSHALMAFDVEVMAPEAFADWLAREGGAATAPAMPGRDVFLAQGCGACHSVRGTPAAGRIGPDLTRLGARRTIAAGTLDNTAEMLEAFIRDPAAIKPAARMPGYPALSRTEAQALVAWLGALR